LGAIVVISGPVGAGKTTVAKALLGTLASPSAYIEGDVFWSFLTRPPPGRGRPRNFQTIMRAMFRAAAAIASDDYTVVLDFSMPPTWVKAASARLDETATHYVELRPALSVCQARSAARAEGRIADYGAYADFYDAFDADERFVIRNDAASSEDVAEEIRAGLAQDRFRLS
jgi:chloramphenicol 3-O-phosphotransferase